MVKSRYFAVALKGWVQVRRAAKPPTPHISKAKVITKQRVWRGNRTTLTFNFEPIVHVLKQTQFVGGHTIAILRPAKFRRITGLSARIGTVQMLTQTQVERIKAAT